MGGRIDGAMRETTGGKETADNRCGESKKGRGKEREGRGGRGRGHALAAPGCFPPHKSTMFPCFSLVSVTFSRLIDGNFFQMVSLTQIFIFLLIKSSLAHKILVFNPTYSFSRVNCITAMVNTLVEAGNEVVSAI